MRKIYVGSFLIACVIVIYACQPVTDLTGKEGVTLALPSQPYAYSTGQNDNVPTLGRVLFYDVRLSANNSVSCATCHKQSKAFADGVAFSTGFLGERTKRNSMPIQNLSGSFNSGNGGVIFNNDSTIIDPGF